MSYDVSMAAETIPITEEQRKALYNEGFRSYAANKGDFDARGYTFGTAEYEALFAGWKQALNLDKDDNVRANLHAWRSPPPPPPAPDDGYNAYAEAKGG